MRAATALTALAILAACQGDPATKGAAEQVTQSRSSTPDLAPKAAPTLVAGEIVERAACAADETPVFACKFADGKRVAICGTKAGKAAYRFGGDTPELALSGGERTYAMYSGGGESQLAFANGDTRYIVFNRLVRTGFDERGNNPAHSAGVVVERPGKFIGIRICENPDLLPFDHDAAEDYLPEAKLPEGQFLFTDETIRADPPGNE